LAARQGLTFELREMGLQKMLDAVAGGQVDAAVAALTITSEREARVDFSHPFLNAGLGIAVRREATGGWLAVGERLVSGPFLTLMGGLLGLLLLVGMLVWLLERRRNEQFGGGPTQGIGSGFWWSAVTMTTVGYGDKAPQTLGGRVLAVIWMFTSVILISSFTAGITTVLTVGELSGKIQGPEDLAQARTLTVTGSTSAQFLTAHHYEHQALPDLATALQRLAEGSADAVVYDAPILRYLLLQDLSDQLKVLAGSFEPQDYGIALPPGSPLREPVNRDLLELLREPLWQEILFRYLGNRS
jgi:ABC-type amino acid transport substrate-binding protein